MATIHEAEIIATATETKGVLEMLIPQILVGGDHTPTSAAAEKMTKTAAAAPAAPEREQDDKAAYQRHLGEIRAAKLSTLKS
ncbi:hypothetical protein THAR02_09287 [Trichoderma harzianum]|uniref:Uncharacterized protein n=1 Tax=Trichoderma harzianum TaxID=5544 RepID=A0A0F9ZE02_TRIHA|nr:hypothetical protein THAR02_09287 [Trichoderma harzianum]